MDIVLVAAGRIVLLLRGGCWHRAIDNQTMEMDNASSSRTFRIGFLLLHILVIHSSCGSLTALIRAIVRQA